MGYGDYGGKVFRNGIRMRSHEDSTPFKETEIEAGYHQAFLKQQINADPYHAILGEKEVRLCAYKLRPYIIFEDGRRISFSDTVRIFSTIFIDDNTKYNFETFEDRFCERLDLYLEVADSKWVGFCGVSTGSGWDKEEDDSPGEKADAWEIDLCPKCSNLMEDHESGECPPCFRCGKRGYAISLLSETPAPVTGFGNWIKSKGNAWRAKCLHCGDQ